MIIGALAALEMELPRHGVEIESGGVQAAMHSLETSNDRDAAAMAR